jgi:hypothetical protein
MNRDNQPTFNVNRKIANFSDYASNKDSLKKANLQTKRNSEDQQHIGNFRNEFDPITHKVTQQTPEEIKDKLDAIEEVENTKESNTIKKFSEDFDWDEVLGKNNTKKEIENDPWTDLEKDMVELADKYSGKFGVDSYGVADAMYQIMDTMFQKK